MDDLKEYENDFVKIAHCKTTFERALAMHRNLKMFSKAAIELPAPRIGSTLLSLYEKTELTTEEKKMARDKVLSTAVRFGKARFAQVTSKYVKHAEVLPKYIVDGLRWIVE